MVLVKFLGNKVVDLDLAIIENLILPQYADEEIAFSFPFHFQEFFLKDPFDLVENEFQEYFNFVSFCQYLYGEYAVYFIVHVRNVPLNCKDVRCEEMISDSLLSDKPAEFVELCMKWISEGKLDTLGVPLQEQMDIYLEYFRTLGKHYLFTYFSGEMVSATATENVDFPTGAENTVELRRQALLDSLRRNVPGTQFRMPALKPVFMNRVGRRDFFTLYPLSFVFVGAFILEDIAAYFKNIKETLGVSISCVITIMRFILESRPFSAILNYAFEGDEGFYTFLEEIIARPHEYLN